MNAIDRIVATFSPRAALDRARARQALSIIDGQRGYDGGKISRRLPALGPSTSANSELNSVSIARLRDRAREMVRNNPYCARALDIWASNVVGAGIVPASRTGKKGVDRKVMDLWRAFVESCDADGQLDFYGLQTLAVRSAFEGGDTLARMRIRRAEDGFRIPLQVQLMEGDQLDSGQHGIVNNNKVVLGVQLNGIGQRAGYYLFPEHPGERGQFALTGLTSNWVPASDVVHLYRKARIGQVRGVSAFAPVMLQAKDLSDLQEAVVVKSRVEACFAGFITSEEADGMALGAASTDADGNQVQELQPGLLRRLKPGEEVTFAQPTSSTSFDPVMLHTLMGIAVGLGLTYDQLTGDLRQANYSSLRAGKIEMRRLIEQVQYQMMVPMFCRPIWRRFIEMCILTGQLRGAVDDYPCEWIAPAHEAIDPEKDLRADVLAVRSGRMTLKQFIAAWGNDPDTHLEQIAADNARLDELGLILDTDPRKMSSAGQMQSLPMEPQPAEDKEQPPESAQQGRAFEIMGESFRIMAESQRMEASKPPIAVTIKNDVENLRLDPSSIPAPIVNVAPAEVRVAPPIVNVAAPIVNLPPPPASEKRKRKTMTTVTEHHKDGRVKSFIQEDIE